MRLVTCGVLLLVATVSLRIAAQTRTAEPFAGVLDEHPTIGYRLKPTHDRVTKLKEALDTGRRSLAYDERSGYLQSVLEALHVAPESQLLVFSKTGIQRALTGPRTPRALYFNESVVVGYIAGAPLLELAAQDPEQGVVFYVIDQRRPTPGAVTSETVSIPSIRRPSNCLSCHVSNNTMDVPGMIVRSMFTAANGDALPQLGSHLVDHRTPLPARWGGWFVTANSALRSGVGHMGNVTTTLHPASGRAGSANDALIEWLDSTPETRGYPSRESDIAPLMLFDHQMRAINLLTRLNWESRIALAEQAADSGRGALAQLIDEAVDYFLFVDEAAPPGRLIPRTGFIERFVAGGPKDGRGRSLRQLDLERRLLRYPCSYMIDSEAFAHLPAPAKRAFYDRLAAVLTGRDTQPKYRHLSLADRTAILEILRATNHDL